MKRKKQKKLHKFWQIFDYKQFVYDFVKITAAISALLYFRMKYIYYGTKRLHLKTKGPIFIVSNHRSFLDPVIMLTMIWNKRVGFLTTSILYTNKFKTWMFNRFGCIKVNKENVSMNTIKSCIERVNRGHSIAIFPEGGISRDELTEFKSGAIMLSFMCEKPILTTYIIKRKHWYNRQKVIIGELFNPRDYIKDAMPSIQQINECSKMLHECEEKLANLASSMEK